jgi:hypothetical protein
MYASMASSPSWEADNENLKIRNRDHKTSSLGLNLIHLDNLSNMAAYVTD